MTNPLQVAQQYLKPVCFKLQDLVTLSFNLFDREGCVLTTCSLLSRLVSSPGLPSCQV